jgi:hypothetical protein
MDANLQVERQQIVVRELVSQRLGLEQFRRAEQHLPPVTPTPPTKRFKHEVPVE